MKRSLLLTALLAGCLDVPPPPHGMCNSSSDCATGEVCEESVCWGDPPMGTFAATLGPPSDRPDLVATELPVLPIPADGWVGDLVMPAPVTLSGRVEAYCAQCDAVSSIGATITIARRSLFAGGPGFRGVFSSKDGIARGTDSFTSTLPRSNDGDPTYIVTVVPDGRGDQPQSTPSPATIAPPLRTELTITGSTSTVFTLGSASSKTVTGTLTDGAHTLAQYRVVALGRWDATSPLTEVSTVDYVGAGRNGQFSLTLADNIDGLVQIVAKPYGQGVVAPTLYLPGVVPGSDHQILQLSNLPPPSDVAFTVYGYAGDGSMQLVSGARVIVTSTYDPLLSSNNVRATLAVEAVTDQFGVAHLSLLDDDRFNAGYTLSVVPPASSSFGIEYQQPLDIHMQPEAIQLSSRFALRGTVVDTTGTPISNVSVTARPSLRFTWSLDDPGQQYLAEIPAATAVTPDDGSFIVWVDPVLSNAWASYDLTCEPPMGSPAPSWTRPDIDIQTPAAVGQKSLTLDSVTIPDAAHIHGRIADSSGDSVLGGELRIFQVITDLELCGTVAHPPDSCSIPAVLMGHGTSDDQGVARLSLPRP